MLPSTIKAHKHMKESKENVVYGSLSLQCLWIFSSGYFTCVLSIPQCSESKSGGAEIYSFTPLELWSGRSWSGEWVQKVLPIFEPENLLAVADIKTARPQLCEIVRPANARNTLPARGSLPDRQLDCRFAQLREAGATRACRPLAHQSPPNTSSATVATESE
jgi:hypothetical protein